jgi:Uma2 family endonuclease
MNRRTPNEKRPYGGNLKSRTGTTAMATVTEKLLTAEEFARLPEPADGSEEELVKGVVVSVPVPGFNHGYIQANVGDLLLGYVRAHRLGHVTLGTGLITERNPDTVRGPDVAFWSAERIPLDRPVPQGYPEVAADLAVEVLSPDDRLRKVREKLREYFTGGVRMVWVVDPENRTVTVYRSPDEGRLLHESATLTGEDVVPGFSCPVAAFFE